MSAAIAAALCITPPVSSAQGFAPTRPVELLVHSAPGGGVRPIAAFTEQRLRVMPGVPTIREQGIQAPIIANVRGILAPPEMLPAAVAYWEDFFARLAKTPGWKRYIEDNHVEDVFMRGADMPAFFDEQIGVMRSVLREAGVAVVQ